MSRNKQDLYTDWDRPECIKIVYPDGALDSQFRKCIKLGYRWVSPYWGDEVEIVEISEEMAWAEELKT